eukprot:EG_transcript_15068
MPKVIVKKIVKKTVLVKKKRKAPEGEAEGEAASPAAKVARVEAEAPPAPQSEAASPAPTPVAAVPPPSAGPTPTSGKSVRFADRQGPNGKSPRQRSKADEPRAPQAPAVCYLQASCDAQALALRLAQAAVEGVKLCRLRKGHTGLILHMSSSAALQASKKGRVEVEGVPFALKSRHTPKQLFMNGDILLVVQKVLSRTVGELASVDWSAGHKEATLGFTKQEDADRALSQGTFDVLPGLAVDLRQSHAQARLFLDLPKLLHLAAASALPGLVRLKFSPTMQSALATFWGADPAKKLLKEGTTEILGRPCKVTTRKAKFVGFTGEYD